MIKKDIDGNDLRDGDLVIEIVQEDKCCCRARTGVIQWSEEKQEYVLQPCYEGPFISTEDSQYKVIDNIHTNPDCLKNNESLFSHYDRLLEKIKEAVRWG